MSKSFEQYINTQTLNLDPDIVGNMGESISTLCTDIFLIVIKLRSAEDAGSYESIVKLIRHYLKRFDSNCKAFGIDPKQHHLAKYALVALIDEVIISSSFDFAEEWISNPLQTIYFNDMVAGENFYKNLEKLLIDSTGNYEIIEIYYFCLCLGFMGKYKDNPDKREKIINGIAHILIDNKPEVNYTQETIDDKEPDSFSLPHISSWLVGGIGCALIIIIWFIAMISTHIHSQNLFPG